MQKQILSEIKKRAVFVAKICALYAIICCASQIVFFTNAKKTPIPNGYFFGSVSYYKNPKTMAARFFELRPSFEYLHYFKVVKKHGDVSTVSIAAIDVKKK